MAEASNLSPPLLQELERYADAPGRERLGAEGASAARRARETSSRDVGRFEAFFESRGARHPRLRSSVALRDRPYETTKRLFDVAFALLTLPLTLPVLGACALLIWLKEGRPIIFAQDRTGRAGRRFKLYKLRTMVKDAAERKQELMSANEQSGPDFKIARDPRITPLGAFLRKYSLDELPQVVNVLRGDMSLVGPRPTSFEASSYDLWHTERLEIAPGLTGLWQISGRAEIDFDTRVRLDLQYVERRSLLFDAWILMRTVREVVRPRGAY